MTCGPAFVLAFVLMALNIPHTWGDVILSCVDNKDELAVFKDCVPVLGSGRVYLSGNTSEVHDVMSRSLRALIYVKEPSCRSALIDYACGVTYPKCGVETYICPCHSVEEAMKTNCKDDSFGSALANETLAGLVELGITDGNRPCARPTNKSHPPPGISSECYNATGASPKIDCPKPLVPGDSAGARELIPSSDFAPEGWEGGAIGACAMPCALRIFSEGEAEASVTLVTSLAWISTACCLFMFIMMHYTSSGGALHQWPERLQVYFVFCVLGLSVSLTFASVIGYSDTMWCEHKSLCTLQAVLLEYFSLALAIWWLAICCNLFLSIVVYRKPDFTLRDIQSATESWEKLYHSLAWGVPLIFTVLLAMLGKLGNPSYGNPSYCWINDENSSLTEFSFFYFEISAFAIVGLILISSVLYTLRQSMLTSGDMTMWKLVKSLAVLLSFIFTFIFTFAFMGGYQIMLANETDEDRDAQTTYIQCQVQRWWQSAASNSTLADCELRSHPDLVLTDIQSAIYASFGIMTFVVFGMGTLIRYLKKHCWSSQTTQASTSQQNAATLEKLIRRKREMDSIPRKRDGVPVDVEGGLTDGLLDHSSDGGKTPTEHSHGGSPNATQAGYHPGNSSHGSSRSRASSHGLNSSGPLAGSHGHSGPGYSGGTPTGTSHLHSGSADRET